MYVYDCLFMYTYIQIYTYIYSYIYIYIYQYIYVFVFVCLYIYVYVFTYIHRAGMRTNCTQTISSKPGPCSRCSWLQVTRFRATSSGSRVRSNGFQVVCGRKCFQSAHTPRTPCRVADFFDQKMEILGSWCVKCSALFRKYRAFGAHTHAHEHAACVTRNWLSPSTHPPTPTLAHTHTFTDVS